MKLFTEALEPLRGKCEGKNLGFIVQYGFREAIHARSLEKYLIKLADMLGCNYLGTVIKGGCDGLCRSPGSGKQILKEIKAMGKTFAERKIFDSDQLKRFAQPEIARKRSLWLLKIATKLINFFYWGQMLKKNGVKISESFARTYE